MKQIVCFCFRYKGKKEIKKSSKYEMSYEDDVASLVIHKTEPSDSGLYRCKATNPLGLAETEGTLDIQSKEIFELNILFAMGLIVFGQKVHCVNCKK